MRKSPVIREKMLARDKRHKGYCSAGPMISHARRGFRRSRHYLELARDRLIGIFAQPRLNAGMTSLANHLSCSLNSSGGNPSAQWIMKSSRPGYLASIDLIPSMT
jgi:hypothetical protein